MSEKNQISVRLVVFWLFVLIPLIWGIMQTVEKSMTLFN